MLLKLDGRIVEMVLSMKCILIFLLVIIFAIYLYIFDYWTSLTISLKETTYSETIEIRRRNVMEMCKLPELDPWDSSIKGFLDPTKGMNVKCNRSIEEVTKLVDGKLFITEKFINTTNCYYRCLFTKDDYNINFGAKQSFTTDPNCDIIEVVCSTKDKNTTFYRYLHTQIYVQKNDSKLKNDTNIQNSMEFAKNNFTKHLPDVHILIFDSTSSSSMYRTMPKTVDYIREKYVATSFKYLNKVGLNSRPNGYAFLLGRLLRQPLEYCIDPVDNDTFIGFEFRDLGYKTLMSEDWALGVFNWPDCWGFKNGQPVDHYMRPFHLLIEGDKYNQRDLRNNIYDKSCNEPHMSQLDYLKKFIDKYKEQPKFSVSWMTRLTHSDVNGLVPADKDYYEFFKEYIDKLQNSYIFVMGDHGLRMSSFRETKIGMIEDNNPALFVILPKKLRKNEMIMNIVQKNSKQLVSHFDLYASFVDIARDPVLSGPANRTSNKEIKLLGSSIFKPLPQPRSCPRFNISLTYCMCQYEYQPFNDMNLLKNISEYSVSWINKQIILNNVSDKCAHLILKNNSAKLEALEPDYRVDIFRITFEVNPSNGKFTGLIMKNMDKITKEISYEVISDRLPRLNLYDTQSKCVINNPNITAYCFCKK